MEFREGSECECTSSESQSCCRSKRRKEIQEFPVNELKFRPRKKKVKVSEKEMKELENLEDKKGD